MCKVDEAEKGQTPKIGCFFFFIKLQRVSCRYIPDRDKTRKVASARKIPPLTCRLRCTDAGSQICVHIRHRAVRCTLHIRYCNGRTHEVQDMCVIRRRREAREPQNAFEGGGGSRWVSPPIAVRIEKKGRQATTAIVANLLADSSSRPIERRGRLQHWLHRPSAGCSTYLYRFVCNLPRAPNPFPLYAL